MPSWLILVLQWGGLALAVLSAAALIYVLGIPGIIEPAAEAEAAAEPVTAPVTLYWVLLVTGAVCAVVGFIMGRRKPTAVGQS
jgi:hypothetical protein